MAIRFIEDEVTDTTIKTPELGGSVKFTEEATTETKVPKSLLARAADNPIVEGVSDVLSQLSFGALETLNVMSGQPPSKDVEEPKTFAGGIARTVGEFALPIPGLDPLTNEAAKRIGASPTVIRKAQQVKKFLQPIADFTKKSIGFVGETLSSVPREFIERAIEREGAGKSIFKGKFVAKEAYEELGSKAQRGINFIEKEAGKEVGEQTAALKGKNALVRTDDIIKSVDDMISEQTVEGVSTLSKSDLKQLDEIKNILKPNKKMRGTLEPVGEGLIDTSKPVVQVEETVAISAEKANLIKRKLQNMTKFDVQTVKKTSGQGDRIIKNTSNQLKKRIEDAVPEIGEVNANFKRIKDIKTRLQSKLKDENVARNLKNIANKDQTTRSLFFELDTLLPDNLKFMDKLSDTVVRESFDSLFPGTGGGSGSAAGGANILRILGVTSTGGAAAPFVSPKGQELLIRGGTAVGKAVKKGLETETGKALATRAGTRALIKRRAN